MPLLMLSALLFSALVASERVGQLPAAAVTATPTAHPSVQIPGTMLLPPHASGDFGGPDVAQPGAPISPGGPRSLDVQNQSDEPVTVNFDNKTLTVAAPQGYLVQFLAGCNGPLENPSSCTISAPLVITCTEIHPPGCSVAFTTVPTVQVTYPPGWNLVAGLGVAITEADGPVYTLQPGDTSYESLPPDAVLDCLKGYWVFFEKPTQVESVACPSSGAAQNGSAPFTASVPANQFIMIGNPLPTPASVAAADAAYTYDPTSGQYQQASTLQPGQGAWVYSASGGSLTLTP